MVKITDDMKIARLTRIRQREAIIDEHITTAVKQGRCSTYFACDKDSEKDIYDEIRANYERAGYKIKPTGYSAGVWQETEDICW